ncbi:MAG TPA: glycosyltransferase family 4 protein [Polyangiaceae bacterium]|nr:glycosyltransferase family 4 protein [Polyangiaceae bacterium]
MKKILLVSYAWPPAGGPGVQRVLKFAKFLPRFGWQPIVLTVRGGTFANIDESLARDVPEQCAVYQGSTMEPTALYKRFIGMKRDDRIPIAVLAEPNPTLKKRVANWVRLNFFIPDAKIGWLPGAIRAGARAIREERPDLIFSSAPPPTTHLVARSLAKQFALPWVADFRDPWTDTHYYEGHTRGSLARRIDEGLEESVCKRADRLVFVSRLDMEAYGERHGVRGKSEHIPNGYDELDFEQLLAAEPRRDKLILAHLGSIGIERHPAGLITAIRLLIDSGVVDRQRIQLQLVGTVQDSVKSAVQEAQLTDLVDFVPYVPHHEALRLATQAHALLLLITQSKHNQRILPGKTFEYLRYGKPLLVLGPPGGEVDRVLQEVGAGRVLAYDDVSGIQAAVSALYSRWQSGDLLQASPVASIDKYTREHLAKQLASVFDGLERSGVSRAH